MQIPVIFKEKIVMNSIKQGSVKRSRLSLMMQLTQMKILLRLILIRGILLKIILSMSKSLIKSTKSLFLFLRSQIRGHLHRTKRYLNYLNGVTTNPFSRIPHP